jgi:hypothetical protein
VLTGIFAAAGGRCDDARETSLDGPRIPDVTPGPFALLPAGVSRLMIRALTTLFGLIAAAVILYFVTDIDQSGGSFWLVALVWAAAGLAIGVLYEAGGRRAPGLRMNLPLLILGFLPWTLLTAALVAVEAGKPVWLADRGRDVLPDRWIPRWDASLPAFAFGAGLLFAFALIEPRVGVRGETPAESSTAPVMPYTPYIPPEPTAPTSVTAVQPAITAGSEPVVTDETDGAETVVANTPEEPVRAVQPTRPDDPDG